MITDSLLTRFAHALAARKGTEVTRVAPVASDGIPGDLVRLLSVVGGWRYGDLRFSEASQLQAEREFWEGLVDDFERGRSEIWGHAFWNRAWYPIATSSVEVFAHDPVGCFGGPPGQVVSFDFKGGDDWFVFASLVEWLTAFTEGLESDATKDAVYAMYEWARVHGKGARVPLPQERAAQRSEQRFAIGIGPWIRLCHADGRRWSIRERRDGYEVEIGEGDDIVKRKRTCQDPSREVRRLVREQESDGFAELFERQ